jgi:hypothetical protein
VPDVQFSLISNHFGHCAIPFVHAGHRSALLQIFLLAISIFSVVRGHRTKTKDCYMAKTTKNVTKRARWTKAEYRELKTLSKAKTPVAKISKQMKRTIGALRQQASKFGIGLGHQQ